MANHKRRRPSNRRAGCKMCKPWKANGVRIEREDSEAYSAHKRRTIADKPVREAVIGAAESEAIQVYKQHIADEWSPLLQEIYEVCRGQWHYAIPEEPDQREHLRELCRRVLPLENYFLEVYYEYVGVKSR